MNTKIPIPVALIKSAFGIAENAKIVRLSVEDDDLVYVYTRSGGKRVLRTAENEDPRLEVNYTVGANETS